LIFDQGSLFFELAASADANLSAGPGPGAVEALRGVGPVGRSGMHITTMFLDIGNVLLTNGWGKQSLEG
jgi:hypothetical protein